MVERGRGEPEASKKSGRGLRLQTHLHLKAGACSRAHLPDVTPRARAASRHIYLVPTGYSNIFGDKLYPQKASFACRKNLPTNYSETVVDFLRSQFVGSQMVLLQAQKQSR